MFGYQEQETEQEFVIPPLKNLDFTINPQQKIICNNLFVAFYGVSSLYVSTLVDNTTPIARINFQKAKQKSLASVYANSDKTEVFIIFNEQFEKMREIHFAEFVNNYFQFKFLVIFTSIAKKMLEKDDGIFLKYLQTSAGTRIQGSQHTEGISGPEADLLQWAEINGRNALCFVGIYSDYEINKQHIEDIFGTVKNLIPLESKYDITKQIKAYNMYKYGNKLYL